MKSTNHANSSSGWFCAPNGRLLAGLLGFAAPTFLSRPLVNAAGWPITAQPATWLEQPALYTLLIGWGIVLLAVLIWKWLYSSSKTVSAKETTTRDFWLQLNLALSTARTFNELLDSCMCLLAEKYHADRGFISIISHKEERLRTVATIGGSPNRKNLPSDGDISASIFQQCISSGQVTMVEGLPAQTLPGDQAKAGDQWLAIPILDERKIIALIALTCDNKPLSGERLLPEVDVIQGVISNGARTFLIAAVGSIHRVSTQAARKLTSTLTGCDRVRDGLERTARLVSKFCPLDYVSLSRHDPESEDEIRWSATVKQSGLVDWQFPILPNAGKDTPARDQLTRPVCDYDLAAAPRPETIFEFCRGMRSRIALPMYDGDRRMATLILAHHQPGQYNETTFTQLEVITRVLAQWLHHLDAEIIAKRNERYLAVLGLLEKPVKGAREEIFTIIRQALAVTAVRLFRYNPRNQTFSLTASSSCRPNGESELMGRNIPAGPLSLHHRTVNRGKICAIDQSDPDSAMSVGENDMVRLGRFKTGILVPLGDQENSRGVLSVTEMRHPLRRKLAEPDRVFLRCVVPRLSSFLADETPDHSMHRLPAVLTAPLTTLGGSVELIRRRNKDKDPRITQYLTNIERATERIRAFAQGETR